MLIDLLQALTFSIDVIRLEGNVAGSFSHRKREGRGGVANREYGTPVKLIGKVLPSDLALDQRCLDRARPPLQEPCNRYARVLSRQCQDRNFVLDPNNVGKGKVRGRQVRDVACSRSKSGRY